MTFSLWVKWFVGFWQSCALLFQPKVFSCIITNNLFWLVPFVPWIFGLFISACGKQCATCTNNSQSNNPLYLHPFPLFLNLAITQFFFNDMVIPFLSFSGSKDHRPFSVQ